MSPPVSRRSRALAFLVATLVYFGAGARAAEQTGGVRGYVVDTDFDAPIVDVRVTVIGTTLSTTTNENGNFLLDGIPAGVYSLSFSVAGFQRNLVNDVSVIPDRLTDVGRVALSQEVIEMEELIVSGDDLLAGTELALIEIRQEALTVQDSIGQDTLSAAGVSDVAGALTMVTGASVAEGKYATVRGLSDRYTGASLNGIRVPSADPRRKAVQIDLFPTGTVESVTVTKTFTPDLQGDYTGGGVDIKTRSIPDEPFLDVKIGTEFNSRATHNPNWLTYVGGGVDPTGFGGKIRDLPEPAADPHFTKDFFTINFVRTDNVNADPADRQAAQQYDEMTTAFAPAMGTTRESTGLNDGFSVTGGKRYSVGGDTLGFVASLTYARKFELYENGENNTAAVSTPTGPMNVLAPRGDSQGTDRILIGALASGVWKPTDKTEISLTLIGNQGADDDARVQTIERSPTSVEFNQTLHYTERSLGSGQLRGSHQWELPGGIFGGLDLDAYVAYNFTRQDEPDVRFFRFGATYVDLDGNGEPDRVNFSWDPPGAPTSTARERSRRIFRKIEENNDQAGANLKIPFHSWTGKDGSIRTGFFFDRSDRVFDKRGFYWEFPKSFRFARDNGTLDERIANRCNQLKIGDNSDDLSALWTDTFYESDRIGIAPELIEDCLGFGSAPLLPNYSDNQLLWTLVLDFQEDVAYDASQIVRASYAMAEIPLLSRLSLVTGARREQTGISIAPEGALTIVIEQGDTRTTRPASPEEVATQIEDTTWLPSVGMIYEIVPKMLLRGSWGKTVARPTFRELAPVLNEEFIFGDVFLGNPFLELSKIDNYDLRWEWFRPDGDLFALSAFYKEIEKPIEVINFSLSTGSETAYKTPVNFETGDLTGFEVETRVGLGKLWRGFEGLSFGANYTELDSAVQIPPQEYEQLESKGLEQTERPLYGQPEFTANANLTYDNQRAGTRAGLFFAAIGDTLVSGAAIGGDGSPNVFEVGRNRLDATFQQRLFRGRGFEMFLTLQAKNLSRPVSERVYRLPTQRYDPAGEPLPLEEIKSLHTSASLYSAALSWKF